MRFAEEDPIQSLKSDGSQVTVLFVSSRGDAGGGGENYLLILMRQLDRSRVRPVVLLPSDGSLRPMLEALDVTVYIEEVDYGWLAPAGPWYRLLKKARERVKRIKDMIEREGIGIVHTNSNQILEGAMAAALAGVRHLYLAHIEFQPNLPVFERFDLTRASFAQLMGQLSTRVVAVSQGVANTLSPPVPIRKIQVIPNGLEFEHFDAALSAVDGSVRREFGFEADSVLVAAVGRIHPDKGFDTLIESAAQVVRSVPNARFLIVGAEEDKTYVAELERAVRERGLTQWIRFAGFREDALKILAEADIFVLSSRREGHPYVLLEAMACACAVVSTRCAGAPETVKEGVTGYLVDVDDASGLAERIKILGLDRQLREQLASAGAEHVRKEFSAQDTVQALTDVYMEMMSESQPFPGNVAVDLFLQGAHEIGHLGTRVLDLEQRLQYVESFVRLFRENRVWKGLRRLVRRT